MKQKILSKKKLLLMIAGVVAALVVCYVVVSVVFQNRFLPRTEINGVNVSGQTAEEASQTLVEAADSYVLTLKERGGGEEQIAAEDIGLEIDFGDAVEQLLQEQNGFTWPAHLFKSESLLGENAVTYDEDSFEQALSALDCMDESQMTDSANASLSEYDAENGYEIVPAVYGTRMDVNNVKSLIANAVTEMQVEFDLEEEGCYIDPAYDEDSDEAKAMQEKANQCVGTTVTYTFGDSTEVVNASLISQWLTVGDDMSVTVDATKVAEYVAGLAEKYNTSGKSKSLMTSYGTAVTVPGGNYGWKINQDETSSALIGYLESGEDYTGDVVYSRTAASHGENDYGNTYVEINLTGQHLWFYKNGSLIVESDFVSGNVSNGNSTPTGAYGVSYKERNAILRGPGYASPVSYWMPFNGGVGMHDATWRSKFGGTIYKTSGSHGCINLPYSVAKKIYENINAADAVLVYTLAGTEKVTQETTEETTTEETTTTETPATTETPTTTETPATTETPTTDAGATTETPTTDPAAGTTGDTTGEAPTTP